jgi:hypothetical protein
MSAEGSRPTQRSDALSSVPLVWQWQSIGPGSNRAAPLPPITGNRDGFTALAPGETGIHFSNQLASAALAQNQILELGSGVALGDIDDDGWPDIYFCAIEGGNRLYRNLGRWRFADITMSAGVACAGQPSTGAAFADVDGDQDLDLLVNVIGQGTRLFRNRGTGTFEEIKNSGLLTAGGSSSLAFGDVDGDGHLDLYVANYHTKTVKDSGPPADLQAGYVDGKFIISPPGIFAPLFLKSGGVNLFELGQADAFYRNDGRGGFIPQSWTNGLFLDESGRALSSPPLDWGLAVLMRDLNGDGAPDIYVCNDFFASPDQIWINQGNGTFRAAPFSSVRHTSMSSMAVDVADLNQDGYDDILVADMMSRDHQRRHRQRGSSIHLQTAVPVRNPQFRPEYPRNTLFLNRGDGTYAEIAPFSGLDASEWTWGVVFLDVDLDGLDDVLMTTGNLRDANDADLSKSAREAKAPTASTRIKAKPNFPRLETPLLAFRNRGDLTFAEHGKEWGFDAVGVAHGMALADLDNDGDRDVVINAMHRPAGIYRNNSPAPRLAVRLRGRSPNTQAIGARITVTHGATPSQRKEVIGGGRYLSHDDALAVFAAGHETNRLDVAVLWRNGTRSTVSNVPPGQLLEIHEAADARPLARGARPDSSGLANAPATPAPPGASSSLFENVSEKIRMPHTAPEFNELERQPLLPRSLNALGPGVAWADLDGDGWDDMVMANGPGGSQVLYLNDQKGGFKPMRRRNLVTHDQSSVLAWRNRAGKVGLLIGSSNYEDAREESPGVLQFSLERENADENIRSGSSAVGPLALGMIGTQQALFVGGRVRPGRYPEPASSRLYRESSQGWQLDSTNSAALQHVGLVSAAVWTDLDNDGHLELVVACEWGSLRLFRFLSGAIREVTDQYGFADARGGWTSVATGDFDGDGRMDLVAGNWGGNTKYQRHRARPIRLYYGDFADLGRVDLLEAYFDAALGHYVPFATLDVLRQSVPPLVVRFSTFADYARASVEEILGDGLDRARYWEASWFASTLFLNRGATFERRVLPPEAQFAPVFGLSVGDADGDGHEDVFLAQNFFGVDADTARLDAGRGLWLRGDGHGHFRAISGQESGVTLWGEQRGTALSDYDRDGRVDLLVAQHGGAYGLFRNAKAKPGLRVRVRGSRAGVDGVGAMLRIQYGGQWGPARMIVSGSGYWSQESLVPVLGLANVPINVWVRWPGGREAITPIPAGAREITLAEEPGAGDVR